MLSPMMTVFVLAVLWLIVVVPMLVRRNDERRRERSVDGFGTMMRALGRRPQDAESRPEVFVPRERRAVAAAPARRPVPAAQEALMYPVDRSEMSAARLQMMARRRRSLTLLSVGAVIFTLLALVVSGMFWLVAVPFLLGIVGYAYFLRSQALRDRDRRSTRLERSTSRERIGYDATEELDRFERAPESIVRIDDDDLELHNMDTIDLTGLYSDEGVEEPAAQRRAS